MSEETKVGSVLKQARKLKDRKLARSLRVTTLYSMIKNAEDFGLLQQFQGTSADFKTREHATAERGGKDDSPKLYGVGLPDHSKADLSTDTFDRSLSTRYSPDRFGVQARRFSDGVYQDPVTNKVYAWIDGFKT